MDKQLFTLLFILVINNSISIKEWWEESKVLELTNDNFDNYIGKDKYVFVKFYTKWCFWCRKLSLTYDQLFEVVTAKREDVLIARIEAQINGLIASRYGIFSFPYLGLFHPGSDKIKDAFSGERELTNLIQWIDERTPIIKKTNLQGGTSKKVEVNSKETPDELNRNDTQATDQEVYFKIEIDKMSTQLKVIEEDINNMKALRRLNNNSNRSNSGYIIKDLDAKRRSKEITITFTPRNCLIFLMCSIAMILLYFSILKYLNKKY